MLSDAEQRIAIDVLEAMIRCAEEGIVITKNSPLVALAKSVVPEANSEGDSLTETASSVTTTGVEVDP